MILKWGTHILYINIYYLRELKRLGVLKSDLVYIYMSLVCPVVAYAHFNTMKCGLLGSQNKFNYHKLNAMLLNILNDQYVMIILYSPYNLYCSTSSCK